MDKMVNYREDNGFLIIDVLFEKLDLYDTPNVLKSVEHAVSTAKCDSIIIDLSSVNTIDSCGIGFLLAVRNRIVKREKGLVIVCSNESLMKTLESTGIDRLFSFYSSLQAVYTVK